MKFKLIEVGGRTLKLSLQISNPTGTPACQDINCICCSTQGEGRRGKRKVGGRQCRINNVTYEIECVVCPEGGYIQKRDQHLQDGPLFFILSAPLLLYTVAGGDTTGRYTVAPIF